MENYIVHCQGLEQYGDEQDWYKFKFGTSYQVTAASANNAIAYVLLKLGEINNDWWMEYPTTVSTWQNWNDYLLTLDDDLAQSKRNNVVKL